MNLNFRIRKEKIHSADKHISALTIGCFFIGFPFYYIEKECYYLFILSLMKYYVNTGFGAFEKQHNSSCHFHKLELARKAQSENTQNEWR